MIAEPAVVATTASRPAPCGRVAAMTVVAVLACAPLITDAHVMGTLLPIWQKASRHEGVLQERGKEVRQL
jgi:hypothetical protein